MSETYIQNHQQRERNSKEAAIAIGNDNGNTIYRLQNKNKKKIPESWNKELCVRDVIAFSHSFGFDGK